MPARRRGPAIAKATDLAATTLWRLKEVASSDVEHFGTKKRHLSLALFVGITRPVSSHLEFLARVATEVCDRKNEGQ